MIKGWGKLLFFAILANGMVNWPYLVYAQTTGQNGSVIISALATGTGGDIKANVTVTNQSTSNSTSGSSPLGLNGIKDGVSYTITWSKSGYSDCTVQGVTFSSSANSQLIAYLIPSGDSGSCKVTLNGSDISSGGTNSGGTNTGTGGGTTGTTGTSGTTDSGSSGAANCLGGSDNGQSQGSQPSVVGTSSNPDLCKCSHWIFNYSLSIDIGSYVACEAATAIQEISLLLVRAAQYMLL